MEALRFGISAGEFWDMTPRETITALDAAAWRIRQGQMQALSTAWHTAALVRAKKLPPLAQLLGRMKGKATEDGGRRTESLAERRREFEEMKERMGRRKTEDGGPGKTEDGGRGTEHGGH